MSGSAFSLPAALRDALGSAAALWRSPSQTGAASLGASQQPASPMAEAPQTWEELLTARFAETGPFGIVRAQRAFREQDAGANAGGTFATAGALSAVAAATALQSAAVRDESFSSSSYAPPVDVDLPQSQASGAAKPASAEARSSSKTEAGAVAKILIVNRLPSEAAPRPIRQPPPARPPAGHSTPISVVVAASEAGLAISARAPRLSADEQIQLMGAIDAIAAEFGTHTASLVINGVVRAQRMGEKSHDD